MANLAQIIMFISVSQTTYKHGNTILSIFSGEYKYWDKIELPAKLRTSRKILHSWIWVVDLENLYYCIAACET